MTVPNASGSASTSPRRVREGERSRAARPLIVAAMFIGFGWVLATELIHSPAYWLFVGLDVVPLVAVAALVASAIAGVARPAGVVVREGVGFVVPASRGFGYLVVAEVLMLAILTGQLINMWTWTTGNDEHQAPYRLWAAAASVILLPFGVLVALLVVAALRGGPQLVLTPAAVVLDDLWGNRTIPWEALRPARPLRLPSRRSMTLNVDRPGLVARLGLFRSSTRRPWLVLAHARVQPWFLAAAIRFYVGHPERRGAIGTQAEYERLLNELSDARGRT